MVSTRIIPLIELKDVRSVGSIDPPIAVVFREKALNVGGPGAENCARNLGNTAVQYVLKVLKLKAYIPCLAVDTIYCSATATATRGQLSGLEL